jgi:hypothetical protein
VRKRLGRNYEIAAEMMKSRMRQKMRATKVREWFQDNINNPEAWDLLWELARMEECQRSMWDRAGDP